MSRVLIAILAGLSAVFVQSIGGEVEGRLFPVMGPLTIHGPAQYPPPSYQHRWKGHAEKRRNCQYVSVEWYLGPRNGRRVQVAFRFTDPPMVRTAGRLSWEGLVIALDPGTVLANSHADVLHWCPWRPWLTRTAFYDSPAR